MGKIAASILSADFTRLGDEVKAVEEAGADYIHIDVMDGHFVPNITIGPMVVKAVRRATTLPLDVHLMITDPDHFVGDFVKAGADIITVHAEAVTHLHRSIQHIRKSGAVPSVSLNPATPLEVLEYVLGDLGMVLLMTVNPGFESQEFIRAVIPKIRQLREMIQSRGSNTEIEVDGGINDQTAPDVIKAGANILVTASFFFGSTNPKAAVGLLKGETRLEK